MRSLSNIFDYKSKHLEIIPQNNGESWGEGSRVLVNQTSGQENEIESVFDLYLDTKRVCPQCQAFA